jgi:hypothetical protein
MHPITLSLHFRTKYIQRLNNIWKNCFSEECRIESFCFRKCLNGNKSLASEINWNHCLFRRNCSTNSRRYRRTICYPLSAAIIIPINRAFIPYNNIIFCHGTSCSRIATISRQISILLAFNSGDSLYGTHLATKNLRSISSKTRKIVVFGIKILGDLSTWSVRISIQITWNCIWKTVTGGSSRSLVGFHRCSPAPKASGLRIHCTLRESILAIYEIRFRLDRRVRFFMEHVITNHGSLLKVHEICSQSMSLLNYLR